MNRGKTSVLRLRALSGPGRCTKSRFGIVPTQEDGKEDVGALAGPSSRRRH